MSAAPIRELRAELIPSPDRLRGAMEIAGLVTLTVLLAMTMQVPEAALSCYMIYYAWRDNAGGMIFEPLKLLAVVTLALGLVVPLLNLTVDSQMLRLALIAGFTFLGMFISQVTSLGSMAGTAGFVFAFALTIYDVVPIPELLSRALTWLWVVMALPMILMTGWGMLGAVRPLRRLKDKIAEREAAIGNAHGPRARRLLDEGMEPADELLFLARLMGEVRDGKADFLAARADESYFHLALAEAGARPRPSHGPSRPEKTPLLIPGAISDPRHVRFALKVLLAVGITYGFYTAFGMFEIHTAMITCFFVALGSRGETHHKILLRLIGCLLGAAAGALVVTLLMPHMTDIGHLLLVVGPVAFGAAWIALGSEKISYAGWQMALCFFLVVLHGFSPQTNVSAGTDRIVGIIVGSAVMWAIFASIWPISAEDDARDALLRLRKRLDTAHAPRSGREAACLRAPLAEATRFADMARLEQETESVARSLEVGEAQYRRLVRGSSDA